MLRSAVLAFAVVLIGALPVPGHAEVRPEVRALYDAMQMRDVIEIMRDEGRTYGDELRAEMFPGRGGAAWDRIVDSLYRVEAMDTVVLERFDAMLEGVDMAPLLAFFGSERGEQIIELEIEARRTMMDPALEEAAKERLADMRADAAPRLDVLDRFVEANELVESNVVGALNSNYAFYSGMMDGGAFESDMTEEQLLADVWAQEPDIRADTFEWVYAYVALAYQPLSDDDIDAYSALSRTDEGRALNLAVFGAFDQMYTTISRALGQSVAQFMAGEDI